MDPIDVHTWDQVSEHHPGLCDGIAAWCRRCGISPEQLRFGIEDTVLVARITHPAFLQAASHCEAQVVSLSWMRVKAGSPERLTYSLKLRLNQYDHGVAGYVHCPAQVTREQAEPIALEGLVRIMAGLRSIELPPGRWSLMGTAAAADDSTARPVVVVGCAAEEPMADASASPISEPPHPNYDRPIAPKQVHSDRPLVATTGTTTMNQRDLDRAIHESNLYPRGSGAPAGTKLNLIRAYNQRRTMIVELVMEHFGAEGYSAEGRIIQRRVTAVLKRIRDSVGSFRGDCWKDDQVGAYLRGGLAEVHPIPSMAS